MKSQIRFFSFAIFVLTAFTAISQEDVPEYTVQVGNFVNPKPGDFAQLQSLGFVYATKRPNYTDVFVGGYGSESEAGKVVENLQLQGYNNAFVSRLNIEGGQSVTVIQLATKRSGDKINWEDLSQAGELYVMINGGQVKIAAGIFPDVPTAKAQLARLQQAGAFKDAFVKNVNNALLHEVTDFETGGAAKKPLIPLVFAEKEKATAPPPPAPAPAEVKKADVPKSYEDVAIIEPAAKASKELTPKGAATTPATPKETPPAKEKAEPVKAEPVKLAAAKETIVPVSFEADLPEIRPNVKRTSAIELQKALKLEGSYKGSLDGYYGKGTRTAYDLAFANNRQLQKYRILAKQMGTPADEAAKGSVQYYVNNLWDDPRASLDGLAASKAPIAKAYRAYFLFASDGAGKDVNSLMNEAIKATFSGKKTTSPKFDPAAKYSYDDIEQLLTHLRYLHEASADSPAAPCWLFRKHPGAALKAFGSQGAESKLKLQACGGFWEWQEVQLLDVIAGDLCGFGQMSEAEAAKSQSLLAQLYLTPKALSDDERKALETWNTNLWKGIDGWSSRDPMLAEIATALKISYYQTEVLFEDFFMDEGFTEKEAKALGLAAMKSLVGHHLERFI